MSARTNTNPDFYRGVVNEVVDSTSGARRDRTIIYSTLDTLTIGPQVGASRDIEQIDPTRNLTVHALDLNLIGPIQVCAGDIQIYCRRLTVGGKDKDGAVFGASLDVAPQEFAGVYEKPFYPEPVSEGPFPGKDGNDIRDSLRKREGKYGTTKEFLDAYANIGEPGADGGSITIVCDQLQLVGRLELKASGGRGYPGCDGQQGGPADPNHLAGGKGGNAGKGGRGGNGGSIVLRYRSINHEDLLSIDTAGGDPGMAGQPGAGGTPQAGSGAFAEPEEGGESGVDEVGSEIALSEIGIACDEVFLHKVVQKAKHMYLFNQPRKFTGNTVEFPSRWEELGELLRWISDALTAYSGLHAKDDPRKINLYKSANSLWLRHKDGNTYDNKAADWIPSLPIKTMFTRFNEALTSRQEIERRFLDMSKRFESKELAQTALNSARASAMEAVGLYQARYVALHDLLTKDVPAQIDRAERAVAAAKERLKLELAAVEADISNQIPYCSLENVLKAGEMMAFAASDPAVAGAMGVVEVSSLVLEATTKIETKHGALPKGVIVEQIVTAKGDLIEGVRGKLFQKDGKGGFEIISEQKLFLTDLDKLKATIADLSGPKPKGLGNQATQPVIKAIDDFVAAIYEHGEARMLYSLYLVQMVEEFNACEEAEIRAAELQAKSDPLTPYSAATVGFFAMLYQNQLENTIEAVVNLQRKYADVSLDKKQNLEFMDKLGNLWLDKPAPEATDINQLALAVEGLKDEIANYGSAQRSAVGSVPKNSNLRGDLKLVITADALLKELKELKTLDNKNKLKGHSLTFTTVPPGTKDGKKDHEFYVANSAGYYDIRITHITPRVIGATTSSGRLNVHIGQRCHATRSTIIDYEHALHTYFRDNERGTSVVHNTTNSLDGTTNDDTGTGSGGILTDRYLDAMGLFGRWVLEIFPGDAGEDNEDLDLSGVTAITIHFSALARSR